MILRKKLLGWTPPAPAIETNTKRDPKFEFSTFGTHKRVMVFEGEPTMFICVHCKMVAHLTSAHLEKNMCMGHTH